MKEDVMNKKRYLTLIIVGISLLLSACVQADCQFTANYQVDLYRVPDSSTDLWGVEPAGITHTIMARTADGYIGFDPGVAQAPNVGLARLRYFQLNAVVSPSCLASVPLVTIADVQADIAASGGP
jgi:hypothetical protein